MPNRAAVGDAEVIDELLARLGRPDYRPVPQRELLHRLNVPPGRRPLFRRTIRSLIDRGRIVKLSRGRLAVAPLSDTVCGTLVRHRDGYGFVVPEDGGEDLFVARRDLGETLSGDKVIARITRRGRAGRLQGVLAEVVERRPRRILGVVARDGRRVTVRPFDSSIGETLHLPATDHRGMAQHQVVEVEVMRAAAAGRSAEGKLLRIVGHLDDPGIDVEVVKHSYGLAEKFPDEVLGAAEALPSRIGPGEKARRRRFDDPPAVTIDGETAQDFDDAIAVQELRGGRFRLFVHIADVSHFVRPDDALDREALQRGTSVYFPGSVIPMLPEKLSNELCSLKPGVDRLVQTVILDIDDEGRVTGTRFADGVIRSAARLTYTQVAEVFEGNPRPRGVPAKLLPMLRAADRLRCLLERRRHERGSIDFDLPEPMILLDVEGAMTGITVEPRNRAHRLIEECMLAANEAVARYLEARAMSCLYRVHDPPDPSKLTALREFVATLGMSFDIESAGATSADLQRLLEQAEGRPEYPLVRQVALRSMRQARYAVENTGHFGLAAPTYCHFTSPIRRYPDLVVHRLLRACRRGKKSSGQNDLSQVADTSSDLERNAEAAERELLAWKKVAFIADRVGDRFEGLVTGVIRSGLFVQLNENLVEGMIRVERLGADSYEFVESRMELRGPRGTAYRLGDQVAVRVDRVDRVLRRVDFSLATKGERTAKRRETASETKPAKRRRSKGRGSGGPRKRQRGRAPARR